VKKGRKRMFVNLLSYKLLLKQINFVLLFKTKIIYISECHGWHLWKGGRKKWDNFNS